MDFKKELNDRINYIEEIINNNLIDENSKKDDLQYQIYEAMNYSVMSGGKRLRPMLLLETSRLFGGADEDTFPFMTAIELIHTYSLVHDDLEAMDNDEYRRGKKTTHVLSEKAGVFGMIGGQVVDIKNDGKKIDINTLDYINELKTGALIEAAMTMGATLAGASKEEITLVNECASMIGQAFQIQDDILDVTSTTEVLGKPVLSDEKNNKSTYVNLLGIEEAGNKVEELSNHAIERLKSLGRENEFLFILIEKLINRNK